MLDSGQTSSIVQPLPAFPWIFTASFSAAALSGAETSGIPFCENRTAYEFGYGSIADTSRVRSSSETSAVSTA